MSLTGFNRRRRELAAAEKETPAPKPVKEKPAVEAPVSKKKARRKK